MKDFEYKRRLRKILYSKITLVSLFAVFAFLAYSAYTSYVVERESADNLNKAAVKLSDLQNREDKLTHDINKLNTETGMEEELRAKFNVTKEGEKVAVIVDNQDNATNSKQEDKSFWSKVGDFFRGIFK